MTTRTTLSALAAFMMGATTLACSGGMDPSELLPSGPESTQDPLRGGNCDKGHNPHCGDAGTPPPASTDAGVEDAAPTRTTDAAAMDAAPPPPPPPSTCTSFTYSAWGACQSNGTQTRTVTSSSPAGCTGGAPVLSQACTYIDGAALYTQYCSSCHGTSKKGSSASSIQTAINNNVGGMGSLSFLTSAQIAAISAAP